MIKNPRMTDFELQNRHEIVFCFCFNYTQLTINRQLRKMGLSMFYDQVS